MSGPAEANLLPSHGIRGPQGEEEAGKRAQGHDHRHIGALASDATGDIAQDRLGLAKAEGGLSSQGRTGSLEAVREKGALRDRVFLFTVTPKVGSHMHPSLSAMSLWWWRNAERAGSGHP